MSYSTEIRSRVQISSQHADAPAVATALKCSILRHRLGNMVT
jgi:hypothetical protein